jgi:hypothetical protein
LRKIDWERGEEKGKSEQEVKRRKKKRGGVCMEVREVEETERGR